MSLTGHERLMRDLSDLMKLAAEFEFHDFRNQRFAAPKLALVQRLRALTENAMSGLYDNTPTEDK